MLYDVPDEILIEIFNFFEFPEILNLTLVCRKFNNLISNNKKLMKKLSIIISKQRDDCNEWNGTRKYSDLIINKIHKEIPKIIEAIRNDLKYLRISNVTIDAKELKKILLNCPTLSKLGLANIKLNNDDEYFDEPMPRLVFDSLSCGYNCKVLKMLMYCQTKSYVSCRTNSDSGEIELLRSFLKLQTMLEKIHFVRFTHDAKIFNDETLNEVKFRLKCLKICKIHEFEIENFLKFLKNHQSSLQHIEIRKMIGTILENEFYLTEILDCVANFTNLKSLYLYQNPLPSIRMPYVERLEISLMFYGESSINLPSMFPNVNDLTINSQKVNEIPKFTKLETLTLSNFTGNDEIDEVLIPSTVKKFSVNTVFPKKSTPFIFGDHQIENFEAEYLVNSDWIGDFLRNLKNKLKYLKIKHCFLSRNRRFERLFEKEPELRNKAEKFVFIDEKDEYDEDSIASEDEDSIASEDEEMEEDYIDF